MWFFVFRFTEKRSLILLFVNWWMDYVDIFTHISFLFGSYIFPFQIFLRRTNGLFNGLMSKLFRFNEINYRFNVDLWLIDLFINNLVVNPYILSQKIKNCGINKEIIFKIHFIFKFVHPISRVDKTTTPSKHFSCVDLQSKFLVFHTTWQGKRYATIRRHLKKTKTVTK